MLQYILLSVLVTYAIAQPALLDSERIVNGTNAKLGEIPYIVSLRVNYHFCGGSILDKRHILTVSHCVVGLNPSYIKIQYGVVSIRSNKNLVQVKNIYTHENYNSSNNWANDVAVLTLADDIIFGKNVKPVVLPEQDEKPPGGTSSVVSGWGLNESGGSTQNYLKRVDIDLFTDQDCEADLAPRYNEIHHVCAGIKGGGKGECNGDSGGPLTANGKQWGIVSWSRKPCTSRGNPGVYARVPSYVNWIRDKQSK